MARVKISLVVTLLLGLVSAAPAGAQQWLNEVKIEKMTVQPNGALYIYTSKPAPDIGCTSTTTNILQLDTNAPFFKEQYSLLLTAFTARKTMNIYVNGCGIYGYAQNTVVSYASN